MKSSFRITALATLVAAFALLTPAMHAQNVARVNVPFSFDYGSQHFAPGVYSLNMDNPKALIINSRTSGGLGLVRTEWEEIQPGLTKLIFRKYGNRYFLAEVFNASSGRHLIVYQSNEERSAAREFAMRNSTATQVAVAALPGGALGD